MQLKSKKKFLLSTSLPTVRATPSVARLALVHQHSLYYYFFFPQIYPLDIELRSKVAPLCASGICKLLATPDLR